MRNVNGRLKVSVTEMKRAEDSVEVIFFTESKEKITANAQQQQRTSE